MRISYRIALLIFFSATAIFDSCKKDNTTSPTKTPEEMLTASTWEIQKIRTLESGNFYYYQRGSANHDLDIENILFKADHTGVYTGPDGVQYAISAWNFIDAEKTQILYTVMFSTPLQVNWENVALTPTTLKYGEYHNLNGVNTMSIATRIPK